MVTPSRCRTFPRRAASTVRPLGQGVFQLSSATVHGGPQRPGGARASREQGLTLDEDDITYFLGRETLIVTKHPGMAMWRERLFVIMTRNAVRATAFFRLPPERVVELGVQVEL